MLILHALSGATNKTWQNKAPDTVSILIFKMPKSSLNPMFDHLLESSHRDDSNKGSNIGFSRGILN